MLVFYDVPDHLVDYHLSTIIIIRLIGFITGKVGRCGEKRDIRWVDGNGVVFEGGICH